MEKLGKMLKNNPIIWILGFSIIVLLIILLIVVLVNRNTARLDILVAPSDATVMVGDTRYKNGIYEGLEEGIYEVEITRDGLESKRLEIELKNGETTKLYLYLTGDGYSYTEEDSKILLLIDEYNNEKEAKDYLKKYPINKVLPIVIEGYSDDSSEYVSFRIDGGKFDDCKNEFCIKITDISGRNRALAEEAAKAKGYDLSDYEVIYEDVSGKGKAF